MIHKFGFIEKILLNNDVIPHPLADTATNVGLGKALLVAVKLGITDQLTTSFQSSSSIAEQCKISEKGCVLILDCLEALGYVTKSDNQYCFNKRGKKFLDPNSPNSFKYFILFSNMLYESFLDLEQTIISGTGKLDYLQNYSEYEWELFTRAMIEISRNNLSEIVGKIKIQPNAKKIIDLGGSHGLYSIALCKKKQDLQATILDFEAVRKYTDECIEEEKMEKQVTFQVCDFVSEELPQNTDIALLFNIIHMFETEDNIKLFTKIYNSLNDGGQLIIFDQIKGVGGKSQLSRALTSYMGINLFHQTNGNTFSFDEVKKWSSTVGFKKYSLSKLHSPGFGLITCVK